VAPLYIACGKTSQFYSSRHWPSAHARMHHRDLSTYAGPAYSFRMNSPQRIQRHELRYLVHLPVSLTLAHKQFHARSENISLGGVLLSCPFLIPEGSKVKVAVSVPAPARPGMLLSARGKVLRVQPKASGGFGVAIKLERSFKFDLQDLISSSGSEQKKPPLPERKNRTVTAQGLHLAWAWHNETQLRPAG
jgi:PilZ domain